MSTEPAAPDPEALQGPPVTAAEKLVRAHRAVLVLLAVGAVLSLYVLWPFRAPLFLAAVLAGALNPTWVRLAERLHGRRALAAGLLTLGLLLTLVLPLASVGTLAVREVIAGLAWLRDVLGVHSVSDVSYDRLPQNIRTFLEQLFDTFHISRAQLAELPGRGLDWVQSSTAPLLGASLGLFGGALLMLAAFYVMLLDGRGALKFVASMSPLTKAQTEELIHEFREVSTLALAGTAATALVQGVLATIGFLIAGVPQALFLGIATLVASFIPVVGTALVWVPVAAITFARGQLGTALFLAIWCGVLVSLSDNVVKPLVMRQGVRLHGGLLFLSLLGGISGFGLLGIILGPLAMSFLLAVHRIYLRDFVQRGR